VFKQDFLLFYSIILTVSTKNYNAMKGKELKKLYVVVL